MGAHRHGRGYVAYYQDTKRSNLQASFSLCLQHSRTNEYDDFGEGGKRQHLSEVELPVPIAGHSVLSTASTRRVNVQAEPAASHQSVHKLNI